LWYLHLTPTQQNISNSNYKLESTLLLLAWNLMVLWFWFPPNTWNQRLIWFRFLKYQNWLSLKKSSKHTHSNLHLQSLFRPLLVFTTFNEECDLYPYPPMNMKNWTYKNSASLLSVPTFSFWHKKFPKKFIESEIHTFKIKEMRSFMTHWRIGFCQIGTTKRFLETIDTIYW
jgi:hypothetical protein